MRLFYLFFILSLLAGEACGQKRQEIYDYDHARKCVRKFVRTEVAGKWGVWTEGKLDGKVHAGWPKKISKEEVRRVFGKRAYSWFSTHLTANRTEWYNFCETEHKGPGVEGSVPWIVKHKIIFLGYTKDGVIILGPDKTVYLE